MKMETPSVSQIVPLPARPHRKSKPKPRKPTLQEIEAKRVRERERHRQRKAAETKAERKRRLAKAKAERVQLRQKLSEDPDAVLTVKEFAAAISVSERQGKDILASDDGPVVTRLSARRIGITRANLRAWLEARSR